MTDEQEKKGGKGPSISTAARREAKRGKPKHSKRFTSLAKTVNPEELLTPDAALNRVKELATAKFDETVDVAVNLGVDPRHGEQMVRGTVNLPYGTGKSRRVAVFARGANADPAKEARADEVGAQDLAERIQKGWAGGTQFDPLLPTPDMLP